MRRRWKALVAVPGILLLIIAATLCLTLIPRLQGAPLPAKYSPYLTTYGDTYKYRLSLDYYEATDLAEKYVQVHRNLGGGDSIDGVEGYYSGIWWDVEIEGVVNRKRSIITFRRRSILDSVQDALGL